MTSIGRFLAKGQATIISCILSMTLGRDIEP
jgi:hypothetical protein